MARAAGTPGHRLSPIARPAGRPGHRPSPIARPAGLSVRRRSPVAAICLCLVATSGLLAAAASAAPALSGRDRHHDARFTLRSTTLTVTLGARSRSRGIAGRRVRVDCASQRRLGDGVARTVRWPSRRRRLRVRLPSSAGKTPVFCSIDSTSLRGRVYHLEAVLR